jgi:hypothetical protein
VACGSLRYSQIAPEAKNFHPKRIGALPVSALPYGEAKGSVDRVVVDVLLHKKWFESVIGGEAIDRQTKENVELAGMLFGYLAKFRAVNYSDPGLSRQIGRICNVDALLVTDVDYWNYTVINDDKVARVGLTMKLVETSTGIVMWNATHSITKTYWFFKPDLADVAHTLVQQMVKKMPY